MKKSSRQNLRKITVMAMLAAVAVVSVYFIKFPLLPSAPFLEYDIADVPVLIGTMLFGPSCYPAHHLGDSGHYRQLIEPHYRLYHALLRVGRAGYSRRSDV